jgi:hypothetical protein
MYDLFNDASNFSHYVVLNARIIVSNELERKWKEVIVA